jgi:predicted transglutaminase-like cysteine proteinase
MWWRGQAQLGTLMHLVFSGTAQSQHHTRSSVVVVWAAGWGRRGLANLEREIENLCCRPRGKLPAVAAGSGYPAHTPVSDVTRPPIGWMEFCVEYYPECKTKPSVRRDILLTTQAWKQLKRINLRVNTHVKPMTDMDHWGVVERWNYPDDGYGDCEDYVLLKRRLLIQLGWPRESLLVTVVSANEDEGHAVLTVTTDKGDYVLDNKREDILPWSETGYHFVKRQSQSDPGVWVSLIDPQPVSATATGLFEILRPRTHD